MGTLSLSMLPHNHEHLQGMGMMTSEKVEFGKNGEMVNCSPLSYKIPNVRCIPRVLNVTLLKNHNYSTVVYSSKVSLFYYFLPLYGK